MNEACHLIKYFNDAILESRFLCLRLLHLMGDLYEAMCIIHGMPNTLTVQPHIPLKVQSQSILTAIQEARQTPRPPIVCIDLTMEEEAQPENAPVKTEDEPGPSRTPPQQQQSSQVQSPQAVPPSTQPTETQMPPSTVPPQGAFVNAFQQFMQQDDNIE